jgi:peptidoglycan hydrolase-like protein with peptidoglycan-binding domain
LTRAKANELNKTTTTNTIHPNTSTSTTSVPVSSKYIFTKDLKKGSENNEVLELQKFLKVQGFLKVDGNGYFGEATTKALKEFQLE